MVTSIQAHTEVPPVSRREFLNYVLGASLALATAGSCGGLAWFMQQQRWAGSAKNGLYMLTPEQFASVSEAPVFVREAQTYLSDSGEGLLALIGECPYEGHLVRWSKTNARFECPSCGSRFQADGRYLKGSAARDLSRGSLRVTTQEGTIHTPEDGSPVPMEGAQSVVLDVRQRVIGMPRPEVGLP